MRKIFLSIYSFGYSAAFIDDKRRKKDFNILTPLRLIDICKKYSISGVEIPIDRYFPIFEPKKIKSFLDLFRKKGLGIKIDFENFSSNYTKELIPILLDFDINFVRTKVSNFYGCNRYKYPEFDSHYKNFIKFLEDIYPVLERYDFKILIENHQDIIIDDYLNIWKNFSNDIIGINWDVGNSLPALESPESFLDKMYQFIGNIHLKDYKIYKSKNGYRLSRCPLGDGIVDFNYIFSFLEKRKLDIPMTIELGAMNSRFSDIYKDEFWEALPQVDYNKKKNFISYIEDNFKFNDDGKSAWENKKTPNEIFFSEITDLEQSIIFLEKLIQLKQR